MVHKKEKNKQKGKCQFGKEVIFSSCTAPFEVSRSYYDHFIACTKYKLHFMRVIRENLR